MAFLKQVWIYLRSSLWFTPMLIVGGLIALGFAALHFDQSMGPMRRFGRLFAAEPEGSQAMLAAIATSMITVAGVVFSITILALAQASAQFSPRVLRNFMRDLFNQIVLGAFVGIFAYCLVVLRNLSSKQETGAAMSVAVFIGFILALVGIVFLISFIHHIASSIQASVMVDGITKETLEVIRQMYPEPDDLRPPALTDPKEEALKSREWHPVPALSFGYVQVVEPKALLKIACRENMVIRMEVAVGEFAYLNQPLVSVTECPQPDPKLIKELNQAYGIDSHQTVDQDPGFGIQQLVDMAVKALSPGINDTMTAVAAVDYLSQILCEIAGRKLDREQYYNGDELRIVARGITFRRVLDEAFDMIIENAQGNKAVITHLLSSLVRISQSTRSPDRLAAILGQAQAVSEIAESSIESSAAAAAAKEHAATVRKAITARLEEIKRDSRNEQP